MRIVSQTISKAVPKLALAAAPTPPERLIPHLLKNLHHSVRQAVDEAFRVQRIEMSFSHFVALINLVAEPGLPGAELARRCFVTAQTMNTILRRLESEGDIERRPHPERARADSWFVTKAGQARLDRARVIGENIWMRMLSVLKATELKQLQGMLERCIRGMDVQLNGVRVPKRMKEGQMKEGPMKQAPVKKAPAAKVVRRRPVR